MYDLKLHFKLYKERENLYTILNFLKRYNLGRFYLVLFYTISPILFYSIIGFIFLNQPYFPYIICSSFALSVFGIVSDPIRLFKYQSYFFNKKKYLKLKKEFEDKDGKYSNYSDSFNSGAIEAVHHNTSLYTTAEINFFYHCVSLYSRSLNEKQKQLSLLKEIKQSETIIKQAKKDEFIKII